MWRSRTQRHLYRRCDRGRLIHEGVEAVVGDLGLKQAHKSFPQATGYLSHKTCVFEQVRTLLQTALPKARSEKFSPAGSHSAAFGESLAIERAR